MRKVLRVRGERTLLGGRTLFGGSYTFVGGGGAVRGGRILLRISAYRPRKFLKNQNRFSVWPRFCEFLRRLAGRLRFFWWKIGAQTLITFEFFTQKKSRGLDNGRNIFPNFVKLTRPRQLGLQLLVIKLNSWSYFVLAPAWSKRHDNLARLQNVAMVVW